MQMVKGRGQKYEIFPWVASSRRGANWIYNIMDGQKRLGKKEEIIAHIEYYFSSPYAEEITQSDTSGEQEAEWLERKFEEEEVR